MDQYFIHDLQQDYYKEINEDEFKQLQEGKENLFRTFVLEERLGFLLMNYAEIEKEAFNLTFEHIRTGYEWNKHRDLSNNLNLKVFNFLSTHQFYEDTVKSTLKSIYGRDSREYEIIENKFLAEYNNPNLFYRTISMIRHHSQHCNLSITLTRLNNELIDTDDGKKGKCNLQFFIKVASLEKNVRV